MLINHRDTKRHTPAHSARNVSLNLLLACGGAATLAAVVGGFAWSRPTTTSPELHYVQSGQLSYSAPLPPGSVYGSAGLTTGEPVYASLVKELRLSFSYQFEASAPVKLEGTEKLTGAISNGQGVTRTFTVGTAGAFRGGHFEAQASFDLSKLETIANEFARISGGASLGSYTVTISPSVAVHGMLGGAKLAASFAPQWSFTYNGTALVPASGPGGNTAGTPSSTSTAGGGLTGGQVATPSWATSLSGSVTAPRPRPAKLWFSGLTVYEARVGSLALLALALAAGAFSLVGVLRDVTSPDEAVRIATRHGSSLVEVESLPDFPSVVPVEVASFAGLMQVATRLECPVLHCAAQGKRAGDTYAIVDNTTLYRYRTAGTAPYERPRAQTPDVSTTPAIVLERTTKLAGLGGSLATAPTRAARG